MSHHVYVLSLTPLMKLISDAFGRTRLVDFIWIRGGEETRKKVIEGLISSFIVNEMLITVYIRYLPTHANECRVHKHERKA
jgi:hypothetical protein